jgi:non-ribosomal peptide synthase protein (TIGR01720 family)
MLCGTGVPGELFIGGEGVAAGYLGRHGLTAERFVPDPLRGGRMYRTGDRVRWTGEGQIEFLGRVDDQVKVRGFRVEPGEVQAALRAHPAVRDAVVVVRDDGPGDRRLVGYVAGSDPDALQGADFRAFLRERLPDYMVPSAFVVLDALPLTPNGKLDARRLPAPDPSRANAAEAASTADAPRNRTEEILCDLWREVLQLDRVGIHDNFFSLGGDSILSIQVIARAAQRGVRVTPGQMFIHQTVAELAAVATPVQEYRAEQDEVTGPVVLTPVQRWFLRREVPDPHHFNIGLVFDLRDVQRAELERAVAAVMAHHDALRMRFRRGADGWAAENAGVGEPAPLEFVDLSAVPAGDVDAEEQARATALQASLDLADGPLIRFALMDRGTGRLARLVVAAHHLVVDAVSLQVLMEDLETAYRQLLRGQPVALPAKTTSFRHWADRLAEYAGSGEVEREAEFWRGQSATPPLPRDGRGPNTEGATERIAVSLDAETTRALLQEVPPVYGTQINDALLAALAMACREWTGESAVRIDLEGHGREDLFDGVDLSRTVGWFTAIHPVRLQVPEGGHAGDALTAVKERLRAVPRRGIGHGLLRWMGDDDHARSLAAIPDPEISFNYLGQVKGGAGDERLFTPADAHAGETRSPRAPRSHLLAVDALVAEGQLHATWAFSPGVHTADTVRRLADGYLDALRAIVDHCRDPEAGGFTPSDFEFAGLDQGGLDALLAQIGG